MMMRKFWLVGYNIIEIKYKAMKNNVIISLNVLDSNIFATKLICEHLINPYIFKPHNKQ